MTEKHIGSCGVDHVTTAMKQLIDHVKHVVFGDDVVQFIWDGESERSSLTITTNISEHASFTSKLRDGEDPIDFYERHWAAASRIKA